MTNEKATPRPDWWTDKMGDDWQPQGRGAVEFTDLDGTVTLQEDTPIWFFGVDGKPGNPIADMLREADEAGSLPDDWPRPPKEAP